MSFLVRLRGDDELTLALLLELEKTRAPTHKAR